MASKSYDKIDFICDDLILQVSTQGITFQDEWPYSIHLLGDIYIDDINSARFLWKSIPSSVKESRLEMVAVWKIGQLLWMRDYAGVHEAIRGFNWSQETRDFSDPDAEMIALSPKTLMATNRFICEVCNKGFQRVQNLQLHRRGQNLPWKLKQKNTKEVVKRKVYLCLELPCIRHDPSRALGDLTSIKKHYFRKHGEKKYKCEKCSKKYAVQSDWKAHSKTCGTREYKCDCGTLFSSQPHSSRCSIYRPEVV